VDSEDDLTLTLKLVDVVQGADPSSALIERTVDLKAQVREIDVRSKTVRTSLGEIKYDKLILALGYEQSLGVKGAERYALKFERLKDALRLREESGKVKRISNSGRRFLGRGVSRSTREEGRFGGRGEEVDLLYATRSFRLR